MEDPRATPQTELRTTTARTDGIQTFRGIPLADLLSRVGASGHTLRITALNEFESMIPLNDPDSATAFLALE